MGDVTVPPGLPLWSDYTRFARRHRAPIGALLGVGLLAGFAWSLLQPASFSATSSVALTPVPVYVMASATELVPPEVSIDTDAQLLHSPRVQEAVGDALGVDADSASGHLSVTASPHTRVLHVTVRSGSAHLAAEAANAAVAALVEVRRDALGALGDDQLRQLRLLASERDDQLAREQARRLVVPPYDDLFAEILQLRTGLDELEQARREPAVVVQPAVPPRSADYANTEVPVTSGAMLGLLAGCLVGAARDRAGTLRRWASAPVFPSPVGPLAGAAATRQEYEHHAV
jgi:uncharacterized protein involved in exopolysaccharide biosynthesis